MPPLPHTARVAVHTRSLAALAVAAAVAACGLSDVFAAASVGDVQFRWESDTLLRIRDTVPIRVSVLVAGQPMEQPHLAVTVLDTTIIQSNAAGDSLYALAAGRSDVVVELLSSLVAGESADTTFEIRVQGGGGPDS